MYNTKTNRQLGQELQVSSRQISKSRKRGWIWKDGKRKKYTAPFPVFITLKSIPKQTKRMKDLNKRSKELANVK
jgi:hypothetical protein|tara:strand:- start:24322 stop:24543 length:222 start_codon:yes stop_codon:yes gene_type:complete